MSKYGILSPHRSKHVSENDSPAAPPDNVDENNNEDENNNNNDLTN